MNPRNRGVVMMGIVIFLVLTSFELVFTTYSIVTKSNKHKAINMTRVILFISFILLCTFSVIKWSFRYYSLAIFLLLQTLIGVYELLNKNETKQYRIGSFIFRRVMTIVMILFVTLPSIIFPQYHPLSTTGCYEVKTVTATYIDFNRRDSYSNTNEKRKLNVQLWFPQAEGKTYPLIIFSHGALGVKTSNETLFNELASHGYIIVSIDHPYHALFTTADEGKTVFANNEYVKELRTENAKINKQQSYEYYQKWMKIRTDDINYVIDYLVNQAKDETSDAFYQLIDVTKIGVMGHSLGGSAALAIGRMRDDISAVMALESPFMFDIVGVDNHDFVFIKEQYPVSVLNIYPDSSWSNLSNWPQYAKNYSLLTETNPSVINVHIEGVGHFSLTDLALTSPFLTRLLNGEKTSANPEHTLKIINEISLDFFDDFLKEGKHTARPF